MFTKKEIDKIFDLLTEYSDERKQKLIEAYHSWDTDQLKLSWLQMCITAKMCNTGAIIRANGTIDNFKQY